MDKSYKIEISMTPYEHDNPANPYYWVLFLCVNDNWCNEGFGWATSPEAAWEEAYKFYRTFKLSS